MLLLSLALILFPFSFLDRAFNTQTKKFIIFLFCVLFIILSGIRWNTGTDWDAYLYSFSAATTYDNAVNSPISFEWGYSVLNLLINKLVGSYTVFLFIFGFITIYIKFFVINRTQFIGCALFSLYIFYCYSMGDIVFGRQSLAISLVLFSFIYILRKELLKFIFCIFLASLIHRSAIICLFLYYIYNLNISKKNMLLIFISSMIVGLTLFNIKISNLNIPILSQISAFAAYQDKIDAYSELGQVSYGQVNSNLSNILGYIRKALFVIPMIILVKKENIVIYRLLNFSIFGSMVYFILGAIATDFKRLGGYFDIFDILIIPAVLYGIDNKKVRYFLILIYSIMIFLRLYTSLFNFWDEYDPFITIFDFHKTRY